MKQFGTMMNHYYDIVKWEVPRHCITPNDYPIVIWLKETTPGFWFGTFGLFFHILGMSSSQLTTIFQDG